VLVGITFDIGLQGAAAQDRLLQEAVEFAGAVLFLEHKVPGLVIGAIRGPERAVSGFGETGKGTGVSPASKPSFVLAP
jgi:serine-type D-Ala-D-Ala carboxypeptidase/endopeptidase